MPATDAHPLDADPREQPRLLKVTGYYSFLLLGWSSLLLPSLIRSFEHSFRRTDADFALLYFLSALAYAAAAFSAGKLYNCRTFSRSSRDRVACDRWRRSRAMTSHDLGQVEFGWG